jgi:phage terminase small subunit
MELTLKQERFCREYLKNGFNGTQAAISAGYSQKTANEQAARLLAKVSIKEFIQKAKKEIDDKDIMTATEILKELSIIAKSDLKNYITIDESGQIRAKSFEEMPENMSRALESISEDRAIKGNADGSQVTVYDKIRFKCHPKIDALKLLGTYRDLWRDKSAERDQDFDLEKFKKLTEDDRKNLSVIAQRVVAIYIKELHATDSR